MQIICISKGIFGGSKEVAERLARKLGYSCLSRDELIEAAIKEGIQVSKLETSMLKPQIFGERLALEREHYLAFTTAYLCERAAEGRLVYHGRTGHLLLPGISHVLRVRVVADEESSIQSTMQELGVDRNKARRYLGDVEEDCRRWARAMYGVPLEDAANYDVVLNLEQFSVENAVSALMGMVQLPDFQMTPASKKAIEDLHLGAKARLMLARDERTCKASFNVRADAGVVTVTYHPQSAKVASAVPEVLKLLEGLRNLSSTMATTNILWIQEAYDPGSEIFREMLEIASKWNAAIELLQFIPEAAGNPVEKQLVESRSAAGGSSSTPGFSSEAYDGIEEDDPPEDPGGDNGFKATLESLARAGCSGGGSTVYGQRDRILSALDRSATYSLVVLGDLFLSKERAARARGCRELQGYLDDRMKAPVVISEELKAQYLFGRRDLVRMVGFLAAVLLIYGLVFTHQEPILRFLSHSDWKAKVLAAAAVFCFVPIVAYLYGTVSKSLMKLLKME